MPKHLLDPPLEGSGGRGATHTRTLQLQQNLPGLLVKAPVENVTSVFLDDRADPCVEKLFNRRYNLVVVIVRLGDARYKTVKVGVVEDDGSTVLVLRAVEVEVRYSGEDIGGDRVPGAAEEGTNSAAYSEQR